MLRHLKGLSFNNLQLKNVLLVGGQTFASDLGSSSFVKSFDGKVFDLRALTSRLFRLNDVIFFS